MTRYIATFHPQAWINDYAVDVDPEGPTTADVTETLAAMTEAQREEAMRPDDYPSDNLRFSPGVPAWWADWSGPFYISVDERD